MLGKLGKDRQEHTRISGQPTGNFQNDVVLGDGICLESPHILPWLPESSLPFGLFGFDSPPSSQSLPYPFPLTQGGGSFPGSALFPYLFPSLPPSDRRSSWGPCCSVTSKDSSREESCGDSFQERGSLALKCQTHPVL